MSCYTSLGVTVAPEEGMHFLRFLKKLDGQPDTVSQGNDGSVSAVWEDRNHFDRYSDDENYDAIMAFLEDLDDDKYIYESVTEDCAPEIGGGYYFGFARVVHYDVYGEPVDLDSVTSENRKRKGLLARLRRR